MNAAQYIKVLFLASLLISNFSLGESPAVLEKAYALYYKLTGTSLTDENPLKAQIVSLVQGGDLKGAAEAITNSHTGSPEFYNNVIKLFALPWNRTHSTTNSANDLTAFLIGSIRDGKTTDQWLSGNYYYADPNPVTGHPAYAENSDAHYDFLEKNSSFFARLKQQTRGSGDIGIFTTRSFAADFYDAGTNRRPIKAIFEILYCIPQTDVKTLLIPTDMVRRDVPRSESGSTHNFQTNCRGCHAQMDPLSNAFGLLDFQNGAIFRRPTFFEKINEPNNYPTYKPTSTNSRFYYVDGQAPILGLKDIPAYGDSPAVTFSPIADGLKMAEVDSLKTLARVIASSTGYARCLATKVVTQMYLKKAWTLSGMTKEDLAALETQKHIIDDYTQKILNKPLITPIFEDAAIEYLNQ